MTSVFGECGLTGVLFACVLTALLCLWRHLSLLTMAGIVTFAITIFLALVMVTKIIAGEERIIYYHHEIAVLSGIALFLRLLRQPVLPYLDVTVLGLGVFLACGRIGCLLVGCCHGRPWRRGITYSQRHASAGFTRYYVGIPLFPVQALESLCAFAIVGVGIRFLLDGSPPGSALAWYIVAYGCGRFCFEFLRGDPDRPYFLGFSEAQWTSVALMSLTVLSEFCRELPCHHWHASVTILIILSVVLVSIDRQLRKAPTRDLLHPSHIREIVDALEFATSGALGPVPQIRVGCTSLGVRISSEITGPAGSIRYYALSRSVPLLTSDAASVLAATICRLKHPRGRFNLVPGNYDVYHCLVQLEPDN